MGKYIILGSWTSQGVANVKDSPARLDGVRKLAKGMGGKVGDFYMTMGGHDMVTIVDMPDDAAMARLALKIAGAGNVRTQTLKAFSEKEYREIVGGLGAKK